MPGATGVNETERVIHGQGSAILAGVPAVPVLDLKAIRTQYTRNLLSTIEGTGHDAGQLRLEMLSAGDGGQLAKFSLTAAVSQTKAQFILDPGIMDPILRLGAGYFTGFDKLGPSAAFTVEEVDIYSKCTSSGWVLITESQPNRAADQPLKLNIDLCDDQGTILVRLKGYEPVITESEVKPADSSITSGVLLLQACWKERTAGLEQVALNYLRRLVIFCEMKGLGTIEALQENIAMQMNGARCLVLQSKFKDVAKRYQTYVAQIF